MKHTRRNKIGYYWTTSPSAVGYADTSTQADEEHAENYRLAAKCAGGITAASGVERVRKEIESCIGQGVFYALYMVWLCDGSQATQDEIDSIVFYN